MERLGGVAAPTFTSSVNLNRGPVSAGLESRSASISPNYSRIVGGPSRPYIPSRMSAEAGTRPSKAALTVTKAEIPGRFMSTPRKDLAAPQKMSRERPRSVNQFPVRRKSIEGYKQRSTEVRKTFHVAKEAHKPQSNTSLQKPFAQSQRLYEFQSRFQPIGKKEAIFKVPALTAKRVELPRHFTASQAPRPQVSHPEIKQSPMVQPERKQFVEKLSVKQAAKQSVKEQKTAVDSTIRAIQYKEAAKTVRALIKAGVERKQAMRSAYQALKTQETFHQTPIRTRQEKIRKVVPSESLQKDEAPIQALKKIRVETNRRQIEQQAFQTRMRNDQLKQAAQTVRQLVSGGIEHSKAVTMAYKAFKSQEQYQPTVSVSEEKVESLRARHATKVMKIQRELVKQTAPEVKLKINIQQKPSTQPELKVQQAVTTRSETQSQKRIQLRIPQLQRISEPLEKKQRYFVVDHQAKQARHAEAVRAIQSAARIKGNEFSGRDIAARMPHSAPQPKEVLSKIIQNVRKSDGSYSDYVTAVSKLPKGSETSLYSNVHSLNERMSPPVAISDHPQDQVSKEAVAIVLKRSTPQLTRLFTYVPTK